jgi:sugar phosphate permease
MSKLPARGMADDQAERLAIRYGRRMTMIGFTCFNIGIGLCYGIFGALVLHLEQLFQADRATMGMALSLVALTHGLSAPVIGGLIPGVGIKPLMILGAILTSVGFAALPFATGGLMMLAIYGLLIGPGTALMGSLPVQTLLGNWYAQASGRMIGFAMMPVAVTVIPMLVVFLLPTLGVKGILFGAAAIAAAIIPLQMMIIDRPAQVGLRPVGAAIDATELERGSRAMPTLSFRQLWRNPYFIMMATAAGVVAGAGVAKSAHLVPILVEQGWSLERSALLLAISGATGMVGSIVFGMIADRWNAALALSMSAFVQAVVWLVLILPANFSLLVADAVIIGMCGGGMVSAKAVLVGRVFGRENFPLVAGLSSFTAIPFLFLLSPLAGFLRQTTGAYQVPLLVIICLLAAAGLMNLTILRLENRVKRRSIPQPAIALPPDLTPIAKP